MERNRCFWYDFGIKNKEENSMDFSEKLVTLRKANDLTQEQLAEKLDVSRQSVSKWEGGQATPELDKIVAMSTVFDVTTDYLLKSSEIDDLSVKTELLEKQQQVMLVREQRRQRMTGCALYATAVYLIFFAAYIVADYCLDFQFKFIFYAGALLSTAIVILICMKASGRKLP